MANNDNLNKSIIEKYEDWKGDHDIDYVYDEIHEFTAELSRGELTKVFEYLLSKKEIIKL